ncbi:RNA-binding protein [Paenibacillus odorifer]|uniref:ASCH domain-containing protein n=1 Tax=Paenibacillus TaxID=44249 RepID=UPI00096F1550|nr:ASCH domain-containing protein [Paenibacillus odorifer]OMD89929.1 RNA-binding protein [Paenibacillus odorifer]
MSNKEKIKLLWKEYTQLHPQKADKYDAWAFGDSPQMADKLLDLVIRGIKTGTASNYDIFETCDETFPQVGGHSIVLDGSGDPQAIIITTEVQIIPFDEVSAEFAYTEGEGDRTLKSWRHDHEQFFTRESLKFSNKPFDPKMKVVCENFKVVYTKG